MPMSPRLLRPRAAASTAFDPRAISGIGGWFDATDASTYTLDTGVTEWRCKAVSGQKWSQTTGASQPTLNSTGIGGKAALSFSGSSQWMNLGSQTIGGNDLFASAGNPFSVYIVCRSTTGSGGGKTLIAKGSGAAATRTCQLLQNNETLTVVARGSLTTSSTNIFPQSTSGVCRLVWNGSAMTAAFNNDTLSITNGTAASVESENITLGCRTASAPSIFWIGLIGEVIFYGKAISSAEQSALFSYLNAKWGLSLT